MRNSGRAKRKEKWNAHRSALGMEKPFDVGTAFSTKTLDMGIKMDARKVTE